MLITVSMGILWKMPIFRCMLTNCATRQCSKIFAVVFLAESIHLIRLVNKVLGQTNNMIHKSLKSLGFGQSPELVGHSCNALVIIQCDFAFESFHQFHNILIVLFHQKERYHTTWSSSHSRTISEKMSIDFVISCTKDL